MYSRRTFITNSVAGGVGAIGTATVLLNPGVTSAQGRRGFRANALDDELARQARQAVQAMARRPGEGMRRLAGILRVKAALDTAETLDVEVRQYLQRELAREGRAALLARPLDPAQLAEEMTQFGLDQPVVPGPIDVIARAQALDLLLGEGLTEFFRRLASALDTQAEAIDRSPYASPITQPRVNRAPAVVEPVQFRQEPVQFFYAPWEICPLLYKQRNELEMIASVVCTASMIATSPPFAGTCVFVSSALATTLLQLYFYGC